MRRAVGHLMSVWYDIRGCKQVVEREEQRLREIDDSNALVAIWKGDPRYRPGNIFVDTERYSGRQLEALYLHEMGHLKDKATMKLLLISGLSMGVGFLVFLATVFSLLLIGDLAGVRDIRHILTNPHIINPSMWLAFVLGFDSGLRRFYPRFEYRADEYAVEKGYQEELESILTEEVDDSSYGIKNRVTARLGRRWYPTKSSRVQHIRRG